MKTHHSKLLKKELLILELPEGTIYKAILGYIGALPDDSLDYHLTTYIASEYTLLGSPDEIKNDDVEQYVESFQFGTKYHPHLRFLNYNTDYFHFETALESFFSAIESEIFWNVNPLQSTPPTEDLSFYDSRKEREIAFEKWHEAQTRTFDRNRTLIFKKN